MAEARRGCGYRKIGGTYLMSGTEGISCGRLPHPLHVCPTCNGGIKQSRSWTWVRPEALLANAMACVTRSIEDVCFVCPMAQPEKLADKDGRCGLLWIGEGFYKTPEDFNREANLQGVCRRVSAVPKGIEVGKTWILLAHPKVMVNEGRLSDEQKEELKLANEEAATKGEALMFGLKVPAIFKAFKLLAIERCVSEEEFKDTEAMDKLREKGVTPVPLPDIPRHRGTVYDKDEDDQPELELGAA